MNDLINKKIALFNNIKFILPYQHIFKNMCNGLDTRPIKKLSSFHPKHNINLWHEIIKAIFILKKQNGINYLAFSYLSLKAKCYFPKFMSISIKENVIIQKVIERYFELSLDALRKQKSVLSLEMNRKESLSPLNRLSRSTKGYHSSINSQIHFPVMSKEENKIKEKEEGEGASHGANEPENNKRIFNIFVGKLNIKSFLRKKQSFRIEKGDYCQYFIISDNANNSNNHKLRNGHSIHNNKSKFSNLFTSMNNKKLSSSSSSHYISTNDPLNNNNQRNSFKDKILLNNQNKSSNKKQTSQRFIRLQKHTNNAFLFPARGGTMREGLHLDLINSKIKANHGIGNHNNKFHIISNKYCQANNIPISSVNKNRLDKAVNYIKKEDLYY